MKIIIILMGLLLICAPAMAANNVEVHVNWPADTVFIGSYNQLQIWIENDVDVLGIAMGFEFTAYSGTIIWDLNYGDDPPGNVENDARGAIAQAFATFGFEDNLLPDSLLMGGPWIPPLFYGLPANGERMCYSFRFYIPEGAPEETLCIDNIFIPPAGDWLFDAGEGPFPPNYHGCVNSSSQNPDCPAVCYPVRTTARLCGDLTLDGSINVADIVQMLNSLLFLPPNYYDYAWVQGDVNCNGRENMGDLGILIEYIFMGGVPPCYDCP